MRSDTTCPDPLTLKMKMLYALGFANKAAQVHTDIKQAPWYVVKADVKKCARLNCITYLLKQISYRDLTATPPKLLPRPAAGSYRRPPIGEQNFVEEIW